MKLPTRIRNDVIGSLLRPAKLKEARARYDQGLISIEQFRSLEDQCVRDAVALQEGLGLAVITDGEYRRLNFQDSFGESVSGYDAGRPTLEFYEKRVEGGSPLQRWEIPDQGEHSSVRTVLLSGSTGKIPKRSIPAWTSSSPTWCRSSAKSFAV